MESQTSVSKRVPREFRNWRVQGNPLTLRQPFANPVPTLRQPFANPLPTFSCQPLSNPLFPWTPGTRLETLVIGFLVIVVIDCAPPVWEFQGIAVTLHNCSKLIGTRITARLHYIIVLKGSVTCPLTQNYYKREITPK